jgi:hypothetical protein
MVGNNGSSSMQNSVRDDSGLVLHIVRDISIAFSMQSVVNYIYIAISSGFFIWRWRRPRTTLERKQMTLVLSAIAIPLIADSVNIFVFDRIFVLTPVLPSISLRPWSIWQSFDII